MAISQARKIARYGWTTTGEPGTLSYIAKHDLRVDPTYQRDQNEAQVAAIRRDFNWLAFGCLVVARRADRTLWVVEGQQRLSAAWGRADVHEVPCIIFDVQTAKAEAQGFLDANERRKPVTSVDKFRARLTTEDPVVERVNALIVSAGYRVSRASGGRVVSCVGVLQRLSALDHDALLAVWPLVVELAAGGPILERVVESLFYLERNATPSVTSEAFRRKLARLGQQRLIDWTAKASAYHAKGGAKIWASGVFDMLNHGARSNLLEWKAQQQVALAKATSTPA